MNFEIIDLENSINKNQSRPITINNIVPILGGDICSAYKVETKTRNYFLKTHQASMIDMFQCEATGLNSIAETESIKTPAVIAYGQTSTCSFLMLEYLELVASGSHANLGVALANMHRHLSDYFGWDQNNYIGTTSQPNTKSSDWIDFWRNMRLKHQLQLAQTNSAPATMLDNCQKLNEELPALFSNYTPTPSLLHGDLWSGNFSFLKNDIPVIYDPACYYGDHEADLAMTELFGGFNQNFYSAYNEHFSVDDGYRVRKDFYNLYHILNHFNLFGGSYAHQAETVCAKVLSDIS